MSSSQPTQSTLRLEGVLLLPIFVLLLLSGCAPFGSVEHCGDGPPRQSQPGLLATDGLVYLSAPDANTVYAMRARDGGLQWHFSPASFLLASDQGILYLQSSNYTVTALRTNTGKPLWSKSDADLFGGSFLVEAHGALYTYPTTTSASEGVLIALQGATGLQRWKTRLPAPRAFQVSEGVVYVLSNQGQLLALSEDTGTILWQVQLAPSSSLLDPSLLTVAQGVLYAYTSQLYALRASDGQRLWQEAVQGWSAPLLHPDQPTPALQVQQGILYLRMLSQIIAFQAGDGHLLWQHQAENYSSAQVVDGLLYAISSDDPHAVDPDVVEVLRASDGHLLWRYQTSVPPLRLWLTASNGRVYLLVAPLGGRSATLLAMQATDGTDVWESSVAAARMILAEGSLYVGLAGNTDLHCYPIAASQAEAIRPEDGTHLWQRELSGGGT